MNSASAERAGIIMAQIYAIPDTSEQMDRLGELITFESQACVVRSLESAFDCPATLDELRLRATHLEQIRRDAKILNLDPATAIGSRILRQMDDKMFDVFVDEVRLHDSPLGMALRAHDFFHITLNAEEVRSLLEANTRLLLSLRKPSQAGHMAHVQIEDGKIVQASDNCEEVKLKPGETYDTILITPKRV